MGNLNLGKKYISFKDNLRHSKYAKENYLFSFKKDPIANFLISKLKMSPLKGIIVALLFTIIVYAAGFLFLLITDKHVVGITRTYLDIIYDIVSIPTVVGFYIWMSTVPSYTMLKISQIHKNFDESLEIRETISHLLKKINNKIIFILGFIIAFLLGTNCIIRMISKLGSVTDNSVNHHFFYFVKVPILWFFSWYMAVVIAIKISIFISILRKVLLKIISGFDEISIKNLRIIKPVKDFLKNFTYFLTASGIALIILVVRGYKYGYLNNKLIIYAGITAYTIISVIVFFSPIHPFYTIISKIKNYKFEKKNFFRIEILLKILSPDLLRNFLLSCCLPPIFLLFFLIVG